MLFENLMFLNVFWIQISFRVSGSESSDGPAKLEPAQPVIDAPWKPSKPEPTEKLRLMLTP